MPQLKAENKHVDVDSSDEGTTPQLSYNKDSNSEFSDSDNEEVTKKGKKGKTVEAFDDIEFSASLDPFGSGAHDPFAEDKKKKKVAVKYILNDDDFGKVIQLSGNQCTKLEFLVGKGIAKKSNIQVHGL
ncbi:hypothetical protein IWW56_002253 [Coemansia sp. RSA 2131]|nr:hypothetical protein IWW56_002253 [Coemansia sp. RSA 2131]